MLQALASISHVAHVTITTRTADSKCSYKASYSDGKLVPLRPGGPAEPKPCAGNQGTQIVVEDLFYNVTTRRKALKSPSEEYGKIADVVTKYAVHNARVAFTLKKYGETVADVRTLQSSSVKDNISLLYGSSVARELLPVSSENTRLGFKMEGFVTNANYSVKKLQFLLFINHRLVDSTALRKGVETVYAAYLPKNTHPFIYMSIEIQPSNVDVNVHPTKHEVHFLHEDVIVESIQKAVEDRLLSCNASRTYFTQALLPGAAVPVAAGSLQLQEDSGNSGTKKNAVSSDKQPYAYQMVRTDAREQKLDAFVVPESLQCADSGPEASVVAMETEGETGVPSVSGDQSGQSGVQDHGGNTVRKKPDSSLSQKESVTPFRRKTRRKEVHLTSVQTLQHSVRSKQHKDLLELFQNHTFVGCVDQTRALVQHQTKLYLIDLSRMSQELFYQLLLFDFANFGVLKLTPPAPMYELAMVALNSSESGWTPEDGPKEKLAQYIVDFLKTKAEMLNDYFSLKIGEEDGCIHTLPMLLTSYSPNLDRLPLFLVRLATEVNWDAEKECFQTFAYECSCFYRIQHDPFLIDSSEGKRGGNEEGERRGGEEEEESHSQAASQDPETASQREGDGQTQSQMNSSLYKKQPWRWMIEHVIFPTLKTDFIPPRKMAEDGSILQIADLHDLYKVFERC